MVLTIEEIWICTVLWKRTIPNPFTVQSERGYFNENKRKTKVGKNFKESRCGLFELVSLHMCKEAHKNNAT
jgi:hypothetical protein